MKKTYIAPTLEVESFELNTAIAASCGTKVDFGPLPSQNPNGAECDAFGDPFDEMETASETAFYETGAVCTCYYSSGGSNYVTS